MIPAEPGIISHPPEFDCCILKNTFIPFEFVHRMRLGGFVEAEGHVERDFDLIPDCEKV